MFTELIRIVPVVDIDGKVLLNALQRIEFEDFEDCIVDECAIRCGADYIVTRNIKDFENSKVKAITPSDFLKIWDESHTEVGNK